MRINALNTYNFKYSSQNLVFNKQDIKTPAQNSNYVSVPSETLKAYSFGKAVSQRDDIYSDTSKFAEYFENKLKKQLKVKSPEDIQKIIDNTVKETNADEKLVCKVMSKVVQFGDFSRLDDLEYSIRDLSYDGLENRFYRTLTSSSCLSYLKRKEQFMNRPRGQYRIEEPLRIIDNAFLEQLKNLDTSSNISYNFKQLMKGAAIIDGWNTKIDGKNMAYTMFGHEYDLETITISIIKEMQKTGKTLDEVLNGDIIKECKNILGEDFEPEVIYAFTQPVLSAEGIAHLMKPKMPTKEQIEAFVNVAANAISGVDIDVDTVKKLICKYLDVTFEAYSTERMNLELKNMHKLIENKVKQLGKTMDDVVYLIPQRDKSFSLISYQYAIANNVPFDKFVEDDGMDHYVKRGVVAPTAKGKVYVVLDDVVASGESFMHSQFDYLNFLKRIDRDSNTNVIWASLHSSKIGKNYVNAFIDSENRKGKDFFISKQFRDFDLNVNDNFENLETFFLEDIIAGKGFNLIGTSVTFPACVTDSDTRLSALFSTFFIRYPNQKQIEDNIKTDWLFSSTFFKMTRDIGSYNEFEPKFL